MINKKSYSVEIDIDLAMDIEQILNGGFFPLTTFLDKKSLESVLKNMRLPSGEIWPIPVLFPKKFDRQIASTDTLLLKFQGKDFAILEDPETSAKMLDTFFCFPILTDGTSQTSSVKFLPFWFVLMNFYAKLAFTIDFIRFDCLGGIILTLSYKKQSFSSSARKSMDGSSWLSLSENSQCLELPEPL